MDIECSGKIIFKLNASIYADRTTGKITQKNEFRLQKRMSCKCEKCQLLVEQVFDDLADGGVHWLTKNRIEDGHLYRVVFRFYEDDFEWWLKEEK